MSNESSKSSQYETEKETIIILGDVTGKGPSAAVAVGVIKSELALHREIDTPMGDILESVNKRLYSTFAGYLTSATTAVVLHDSGAIEVYSCGSQGVVEVNTDANSVSFHSGSSSSLGHSDLCKPYYKSLGIQNNRVIMFFSDGLLEGSRSLARLRKIHTKSPIQRNMDEWYKFVDEIGAANRLDDDKTMVVIKAA